jgi:hypothetical protein
MLLNAGFVPQSNYPDCKESRSMPVILKGLMVPLVFVCLFVVKLENNILYKCYSFFFFFC